MNLVLASPCVASAVFVSLVFVSLASADEPAVRAAARGRLVQQRA